MRKALGGGVVAVVIVCAVVLFRLSAGSPPAAATTAAQVPLQFKGNEAPITRSGDGSAQTPWFYLVGGDYTITWQATAGGLGCYYRGNLVERSGSASTDAGGAMFLGAGPHTEHSLVASVPNGDYYLDVLSGCRWSVTITPI